MVLAWTTNLGTRAKRIRTGDRKDHKEIKGHRVLYKLLIDTVSCRNR
jgi:hypothetical protein